MAYKQPRVPPMKEETQLAAYIRELILFLKDFSLETWMAVRKLEGKRSEQPQEDEPAESLTAQEVGSMLEKQAQVLRTEMKESAESTRRAAIDGALPVGIVISLATAEDPNTLYPWQVWTQITDGRVEIAANGEYPLGSTGGEKTHALTVNEMPSHKHTISDGFWNYRESGEGYPGTVYKSSSTPLQTSSRDVTQSAGGGVAHNNMQPYVARNVWQRTQ